MHPHFVKEEEYALPPLGLLSALSKGELEAGMAEVLKMTDKLEAGCRICSLSTRTSYGTPAPS
jgi:hypothetical protein